MLIQRLEQEQENKEELAASSLARGMRVDRV